MAPLGLLGTTSTPAPLRPLPRGPACGPGGTGFSGPGRAPWSPLPHLSRRRQARWVPSPLPSCCPTSAALTQVSLCPHLGAASGDLAGSTLSSPAHSTSRCWVTIAGASFTASRRPPAAKPPALSGPTGGGGGGAKQRGGAGAARQAGPPTARGEGAGRGRGQPPSRAPAPAPAEVYSVLITSEHNTTPTP